MRSLADVHAFRHRYRAAISPGYQVSLHAGFVVAWGLAAIAGFASQLHLPTGWDWLALPAAFLFANGAEYAIHRQLGHRKTRIGKLFYQRHTGDHHSFFTAEAMAPEGMRDWRVILFPPWLIVVFSLLGALPAWWLLQALGFSPNFAALFALGLVTSYLLYETLHAIEHLPASLLITQLPGLRQLRRLHQLHHRPQHMCEHNLNLVLPLTDWLLGSLHWEAIVDDADVPITTQHHEVDIAGTPAAVLHYAASPQFWPAWHPSSRQIWVAPGQALAGARFREAIHAGGRPGELAWQALAYTPGRHWRAEARGPHGLWLRVNYTVSALPEGGTRFVRDLEYRLPGFCWGLYNRLLARRRVEAESVLSMQQLKRASEAALAADATPPAHPPAPATATHGQ